MTLFEIGRLLISTCAGFSALMAVMTVAAWIDGRMAVRVVREEAKRLTSEPVTDVISVFKCAVCAGRFLRGQPGHLRIGDGFEFCSRDCQEHPLSFPALFDEEIRLS